MFETFWNVFNLFWNIFKSFLNLFSIILVGVGENIHFVAVLIEKFPYNLKMTLKDVSDLSLSESAPRRECPTKFLKLEVAVLSFPAILLDVFCKYSKNSPPPSPLKVQSGVVECPKLLQDKK